MRIKMNSPMHKTNKNNSLTIKLATTTLLTTALLMVATTASVAEDVNMAYVDSIHKWGAWELDIEPAAGGLSQPQTQALNARNSKVALRTNSVAALAPPASPKSPVVFSPPSAPIVPNVVPVTPPTPPVTPPSHSAPTTIAPPAATPPTVVTLPASFR